MWLFNEITMPLITQNVKLNPKPLIFNEYYHKKIHPEVSGWMCYREPSFLLRKRLETGELFNSKPSTAQVNRQLSTANY